MVFTRLPQTVGTFGVESCLFANMVLVLSKRKRHINGRRKEIVFRARKSTQKEPPKHMSQNSK